MAAESMHGLHYTTVDPSMPGLYFECKCQDTECKSCGMLTYAFIGCDGCFDFKDESSKCVCLHCRKQVDQIIGILLKNCEWSYRGELHDGTLQCSETKCAQSSYHLEEILMFTWKWLKVMVNPLTQGPLKRRRPSASDSEPREEQKTSAIEPMNSVLKLQAAGFPSIEVIREDVQRKQEIIDILRAETKHKEKEKRSLEVKVQKLREEVITTQVERLKKAKNPHNAESDS